MKITLERLFFIVELPKKYNVKIKNNYLFFYKNNLIFFHSLHTHIM